MQMTTRDTLAGDVNTAGREFARKYTNTTTELQLQEGIYRRIDTILNDFADEHPNLRASIVLREVDESYFPSPQYPVEALTRPSLQGIAIDTSTIFEFVAFSHGLRCDVVELNSIVHIQEQWLEPKPEEPFILRTTITHNFPAITVIRASTGESQDAVREFIARLRYLRGW